MAVAKLAPDLSAGFDAQPPLQDELKLECTVMIKFALASGFRIPPAAVPALQVLSDWAPGVANRTTALTSDDLNTLTQAHEQLSQLVAPATPRTLLYMLSELSKKDRWQFLGPVRIVAGIVAGALGFLFAFILLSVLVTEYPHRLLLYHNQLLAAAGLGGSFSALFEASKYIVNSSFDPRYKGYYWVKIVLGLTAGYILAELIRSVGGTGAEGADAIQSSFTQATLAVLGGFSGTVVYNILKRLSESVESMVQGDPHVAVAAQQTSARAQATDEINRTKLKQAASLMEIQNLLSSANSNPDDVRKRITQLVSDLGVGGPDTGTNSNGRSASSNGGAAAAARAIADHGGQAEQTTPVSQPTQQVESGTSGQGGN